MKPDEDPIVLIGASVAGEAFVTRLRELGVDDDIVAIDRDARMPYDRPPLSKRYLSDPQTTEISVEWHKSVQVIHGEAVHVDPEAHQIRLVSPDADRTKTVRYRQLVIATGAAPVSLPFEPEGVLHLRTADDSDRIRSAALASERIGVIGAGAIGVELATSLTRLGAHVIVVDKADRPLERLLVGHLGADISSWLQAFGIDCRWNADITGISGEPGAWTLHLGLEEDLPVDVLVSAVGVRPITGWLADSGLLTDGALICDEHGRVLAENGQAEAIFAIGDVATRRLADGRQVRTESWTAAAEQGARLAELIAGHVPASEELSYFWTEVAGRNVQVLGDLNRQGSIEVAFDNPTRGSVLYKVVADTGHEGWIGVNAQPKIAQLRQSHTHH